jgi:hypothetical protein
MDDQRVEAAELLAKCEGMEKSFYAFFFRHSWCPIRQDFDGGEFVVIKRGLENRGCDQLVGLWLKVQDGDPWSSSAILARAGYVIYIFEGRWYVDNENGIVDSFLSLEELPPEMQETANILGICKLYEIDRAAYDKAMAPLLQDGQPDPKT